MTKGWWAARGRKTGERFCNVEKRVFVLGSDQMKEQREGAAGGVVPGKVGVGV